MREVQLIAAIGHAFDALNVKIEEWEGEIASRFKKRIPNVQSTDHDHPIGRRVYESVEHVAKFIEAWNNFCLGTHSTQALLRSNTDLRSFQGPVCDILNCSNSSNATGGFLIATMLLFTFALPAE